MSSMVYLQEMLPTLSPIENRIAVYFIEHADQLTTTPILQVAQACDTSKSAVVRLCKRLGYHGYKDFLNALSAELAVSQLSHTADYDDVYPDSSIGSICTIVTRNSVSALENTLRLMDMDAMERAAEAISAASRVDFYGVGNSGVIAQDAEMKFRRIGFHAYAATDSHRQAIWAVTLRPGDVAMFFSYYGQTKDILDTLALAKRQGATTIALTRFGKNALADQVDIVLNVASTESLARSGAMASRLVMLEVLDMLFTIVSSRNYTKVRDVLERTASAVREKRMQK